MKNSMLFKICSSVHDIGKYGKSNSMPLNGCKKGHTYQKSNINKEKVKEYLGKSAPMTSTLQSVLV